MKNVITALVSAFSQMIGIAGFVIGLAFLGMFVMQRGLTERSLSVPAVAILAVVGFIVIACARLLFLQYKNERLDLDQDCVQRGKEALKELSLSKSAENADLRKENASLRRQLEEWSARSERDTLLQEVQQVANLLSPDCAFWSWNGSVLEGEIIDLCRRCTAFDLQRMKRIGSSVDTVVMLRWFYDPVSDVQTVTATACSKSSQHGRLLPEEELEKNLALLNQEIRENIEAEKASRGLRHAV